MSIQFQARTGRALLKADLSAFPLAEVEDELDRLLQNRRASYGPEQVADVLGEIGTFPGRSMRRLARTATGRSCFTSLSCTASCAHTPQPRAGTSSSLTAKNATRSVMTGLRRSLASSRQMSAQLVKQARDAGFLKPTKAPARGGELTGLRGTSSATASSTVATQTHTTRNGGVSRSTRTTADRCLPSVRKN